MHKNINKYFSLLLILHVNDPSGELYCLVSHLKSLILLVKTPFSKDSVHSIPIVCSVCQGCSNCLRTNRYERNVLTVHCVFTVKTVFWKLKLPQHRSWYSWAARSKSPDPSHFYRHKLKSTDGQSWGDFRNISQSGRFSFILSNHRSGGKANLHTASTRRPRMQLFRCLL